jgi:methyltransferase family protein
VHKHQLLQGLHERLRPRSYFEIGVRKGKSLALSTAPSVGVDPYYEVSSELRCDLHLVRTTSDEFFARRHPFAHFREPVVDLAFIDGMHLSEFALRDFINTERHCHAGSVIVMDDVLPRNVVEAGRGRVGSAARGAWAGDVYKVVDVLRRYRPDLVVLEVATSPTGTLVVLLPDPADRVLAEAYDALVPDLVVPDPQVVPESFLTRDRALQPAELLATPVWEDVRRLRAGRAHGSREAFAAAFSRAGLINIEETR